MSERHFGSVDRDMVNVDCWLAIGLGAVRYPQRPTVRLTAGEPSLARGERAINVKLTLPRALFEAPSIVARIDVASPALPVTIDAQAVTDAVKSAISMDIDLRVVPPEGDQA